MAATTAEAERPVVVETHTAVLELVGDRVRKTKKPVDLGFVDLTTVEARRRACEDEVRLNRRLASDVYLGVVDRPGADGTPEPTVSMRRLPDEQRLDHLVAAGDDVTAALDSVARQIVHLHEATPPDPARDRLGSAATLRRRWHESSARLRPLLQGSPLADLDAEVIELADTYLAGRVELFDQRVAAGRVRDGHGDLRAEDIYVVDDRAVILDCIEFDADYRWGDVLADVAFLVMDLRMAGHPVMAQHFVDRYRELSGDQWPASLLDHFVAYRAYVRATVVALQAAQRGEDPAAAARSLLTASHAALRASEVRLVVVGGPPGTGKSTVSPELAHVLGAVRLSSDEVRPAVAAAADPAHRYESRARHAVYDEMRRRARLLLTGGEHVVFDATCSTIAERDLLRRLAADTDTRIDEICCQAPTLTAARRVADRCVRGTGLSEVTAVQSMDLAAQFPDWPEAVVLDTSGSIADTLDRARRLISDADGTLRG